MTRWLKIIQKIKKQTVIVVHNEGRARIAGLLTSLFVNSIKMLFFINIYCTAVVVVDENVFLSN